MVLRIGEAVRSAEFEGLVNVDRESARHLFSADLITLDFCAAPRLALPGRGDVPLRLAFCGDIVLDPFAGSGSSLIAAEKTGRRARCIEYEPKYCDVIVRRWQAYTGKAALFEGTDLTFEDFEGARSSSPAGRGATPLSPAGPAEELPQ